MKIIQEITHFLRQMEGPEKDAPTDEPLNLIIQIPPERRIRFRKMLEGLNLLNQILGVDTKDDTQTRDPEPGPEKTEQRQDFCSYCYLGLDRLPIGMRFCSTEGQTKDCTLKQLQG